MRISFRLEFSTEGSRVRRGAKRMTDWIDDLHTEHTVRKMDEQLEAEKRTIAGDATGGWLRQVVSQMTTDIKKYENIFGGNNSKYRF